MKQSSISAGLLGQSQLLLFTYGWIQLKIIKKNETKKYFRISLRTTSTIVFIAWK
jgi:hypothetical protein